MLIITIIFIKFFLLINVVNVIPLKNITNNYYCNIRIDKIIGIGIKLNTINGIEYCSYLGIPYAKPPIGNLRFELPQKLRPNNGNDRNKKTYNFIKNGNICVQMVYDEYISTTKIVGNEDCLYLNIFTRLMKNKDRNKQQRQQSSDKKKSNETIRSNINNNNNNNNNNYYNRRKTMIKTSLKPVLVWIHGGSFNVGSAHSDINGPDFFIEKNIIVVTINYRLGIFGFLSIPESNIFGNYGLYDQRLALEWIKNNIKYFNGDPNNITLMGWSAGAAAITYHLYSTKSRNLFNRVILMSGNMLNPWAFNGKPNLCTSLLLNDIYYQNVTIDYKNLKHQLKQFKIEQFYTNSLNGMYLQNFGVMDFCYVPTIDNRFLNLHPNKLIKYKSIENNNKSILIGVTSSEFIDPVQYQINYLQNFEYKNTDYPNANESMKQILFNYLKTKIKFPIEYTKHMKFNWFIKFLNLINIYYGINQFIEKSTECKNCKIYFYRFSFDGKFGYYKEKLIDALRNSDHGRRRNKNMIIKNISKMGPVHGDDLGYLFLNNGDKNNNYLNKSIDLTNEHLIQRQMIEMWSNFIKYGNPTPKLNKLINIIWPLYNKMNNKLINIDLPLTLIDNYIDVNNYGCYELWDSIYKCLYECNCNHFINQYLISNKTIV